VKVDLSDLKAFLAVARAKGFREGARVSGSSASGLSVAVSRLEEQLGVRLLHRTTRSVVLTEAGDLLLERLGPALTEIESALDPVNVFRDKPAGTLRLNVPLSAARLVLPAIVPAFLSAYPDMRDNLRDRQLGTSEGGAFSRAGAIKLKSVRSRPPFGWAGRGKARLRD
jgi:DNA-binding transcriptional LysR family regulator